MPEDGDVKKHDGDVKKRGGAAEEPPIFARNSSGPGIGMLEDWEVALQVVSATTDGRTKEPNWATDHIYHDIRLKKCIKFSKTR